MDAANLASLVKALRPGGVGLYVTDLTTARRIRNSARAEHGCEERHGNLLIFPGAKTVNVIALSRERQVLVGPTHRLQGLRCDEFRIDGFASYEVEALLAGARRK